MEIFIDLMPSMLQALGTTIFYAVIVWTLSIPLSLPIALLRIANTPLKWIVRAYINLMRGTPLLLQLMFIYFGLPYVGITFQREQAAIIAFVFNYTAYFAEIMRSGIQHVDKGQWEAAKVLGISKLQAFTKIVMPQVIKNVLPALTNEAATLIKDTSLIYVLGISELLKTGRTAVNTLSSLLPFAMVGVFYLILISATNAIFNYIEKKYSYY